MLRLFRLYSNVTKEAINIKEVLKLSNEDFQRGIKLYREYREFNDTPDWCSIKLSSIAMSQGNRIDAENILKEKFEEGGSRHARNVEVSDDQLVAAIDRVIRSGNDECFDYFEMLRKYRFCTNRDVFVWPMIKNLVERKNSETAAMKLKALFKREKKVKNMTMSVYYILKHAMECEEIVRGLVRDRTLRNLKLFVFLEKLSSIEFADHLKSNEQVMKYEDYKFLTEMSARVRSLTALKKLLDLNDFKKIPEKCHMDIYDEMIKIVGKLEQTPEFEDIFRRISSSRILTMDEKWKLCSKIRHFYKCLNVKAPEELVAYINKLARSLN